MPSTPWDAQPSQSLTAGTGEQHCNPRQKWSRRTSSVARSSRLHQRCLGMVLKVRKAACFGSGSLTTDVFVEPPKQKFKAVYKFNEGSSSAVRKPIKMSALM